MKRAVPILLSFIIGIALLQPRARAASLDAALGAVSVDVTSPMVYTPDDYGDPWMYYRLFNKPERGWYLDVAAIVRDILRGSGVFAASGVESVSVMAVMVELEEHGPSYDVDLTMGFRYRLRDSVGTVLLDRVVKSKGQATVSEYFDGGSRVKLGVQRALEDNLASYLAILRKELPVGLAELRRRAKPVRKATPARPGRPVTAAKRFNDTPVDIHFKPGPVRPKDIAVVIGNADYGKNIPDVFPAYADAEGFKRYAKTALGIREGNIIDLRDASQAELVSVFGTESNHRGKLFNWVQPGISKVFVYYAGHGAPGKGGDAYLVPVDADPATLHLNGIRLERLYLNLTKIPAISITVVLEACFSGASQSGSVISNASPVFLRAKTPKVPKGITVLSAGSANQLASWEKDKTSGLFTKYFLTGMSGAADVKPYGNGDGRVEYRELDAYLEDTLTYYARRYYGRDQTAQIVVGQ